MLAAEFADQDVGGALPLIYPRDFAVGPRDTS